MPVIHCFLPVCYKDDFSQFEAALISLKKANIPTGYRLRVLVCVDSPMNNDLYNKLKEVVKFVRNAVIIRNTSNSGLAANLNNAVCSTDLGTDDFIMRLDADDVCLQDRIQTQVEFLVDNLQYDLVGSWAYVINDRGDHTGMIKKGCGEFDPLDHHINKIIHPSVMLRSNFFKRFGLYDVEFKFAQDWELWCRASTLGAKMYILPAPLLKFRVGDGLPIRRKATQKFVITIAKTYYKRRLIQCLILLRAFLIYIFPSQVLKIAYRMFTK
jgi:glycosyltransferase involved in cell wall biosynthesis